ncbi:hypothetical protein [Desulfomicrobium salsuginis]
MRRVRFRRNEISEVFMRVWLPDFIYKPFPLIVATIGLLGCFAGTAPSMGLGGSLILYSGGVLCMRQR